MIYQNYPLLATITASQILSILSTIDEKWTEDSSTQLSCKSCQRAVTLVHCLAPTFQSISSHTSSMGFKSTDCTDQDLSRRMCCFFDFNASLAEFTSMLSVIILHVYILELPAIFSIGLSDAAVCCDSQSDSIYPSPVWKSPTLQLAKAPHIITGPPPCFTVGVIMGVVVLSSTLHHT